MKKQLLLILGLMFTATLFAAPVSRERAKENVMSFLKSKGGNKMFATAGANKMQVTNVEIEANSDAYYVFNIGNNRGFVIVSADDRTEPILGYSYEGSFDPENVPVNMQEWLNGYAKQIKLVKESNIVAPRMLAAEGAKKPFRHFIPTMLTCRWNQTTPFNDDCPDFKDGYGKRPTGCVATAMAQVMYYHKWPKEEIPAIPGYEFYDDPTYGGDGRNHSMDGMPAVQFDWDNMIDEYSYSSLKESKKAVAELMRYCGQSLRMGYHPYASGAYTYDLPSALRDYMGYDKGAKFLDRQGYTSQEWEDIVYNELINNRPVLYSGMSWGAGGHQFVCDGYENEYFHFNWGWGGVSDGYFKLNVLEPEQEGVVGGNGLNFSDGQQIIVGVQPPVEGTVKPTDSPVIGKMLLSKNFDGQFKKNNLGKITIYLTSRFAFDAEKDGIYRVGFGVFDESGKLLSIVKEIDKQFIAGFTDTHSDLNGSVSIDKESIEKDGTVYLRAIVKSNQTGEWNAAPHSDKVFFKMDVNGEYVQVTPYPLVKADIKDLRIEGTMYQAAEIHVKATICNKGEDIDGLLYLSMDGKPQTTISQPVIMKKGEEKEFDITFNTPQYEEASFGMAINGILLGEEINVKLTPSETKSATLEFVPAEGFTSEGNFFDIPVKVTNRSKVNDYKSPIRGILYKKSGYNYIPVQSVLVPVEVEKEGSVDINLHFDNLDFNNIYYLGFANYVYGREKIYGGTDQNGNPKKVFSKYKAADALSYYDANGHMEYKVINEGETFDVPANACYVEIPKTVSGRTINKSANPNCIYKLRPGVSVKTLEGCNLIRNKAANDITLTDAYDFYCAETFPAQNVNVTINVESNITTLWLPFEPETATVDGVELKRGHSVDEIATSDYVLLPLVAEDENTVYCDFDENFTSAPCVLYVNPKYVGKGIVFGIATASLTLTENQLRGSNFNVFGSNKFIESGDIYGFGITDFSSEIKKAAPFRIYLKSTGANPFKVAVSYPDDFIANGIEDVNAEDMNGKTVNVYSIDGVKVRTTVYGDKMLEGLPSGLYIVNGSKFVK